MDATQVVLTTLGVGEGLPPKLRNQVDAIHKVLVQLLAAVRKLSPRLFVSNITSALSNTAFPLVLVDL